MITDDQVLTNRDAVLGAVGHHPFARHALGRATPTAAYQRDGAVLWLVPPEHGPAGCAIGPANRRWRSVSRSPPTGCCARGSGCTCPGTIAVC